MNKSESIKELAGALNKFQASISGAKKTSKNPFFKSSYADLKEVIECAKTPLADNGISYSQFPVSDDGKAGVRTILMHESGEWIEEVLLLACSKQDPQAYGSAITYARRYALQAILGIPSEDDDANTATFTQYSGSPKREAPKPKPKPQSMSHISNEMKAFQNSNIGLKPLEESMPTEMNIPSTANLATDKQRKMIYAKCKGLDMAPNDAVAMMDLMFKKKKSEELTRSEASEMISALKEMEESK